MGSSARHALVSASDSVQVKSHFQGHEEQCRATQSKAQPSKTEKKKNAYCCVRLGIGCRGLQIIGPGPAHRQLPPGEAEGSTQRPAFIIRDQRSCREFAETSVRFRVLELLVLRSQAASPRCSNSYFCRHIPLQSPWQQ